MTDYQARRQLKAIAEAAQHLDSLMAINLKLTNKHLLWAEWHFAKALLDWHGTDVDDAFQAACDNLGVDSEGESLPPESRRLGCDEADYRYDMDREVAA